jgi:hypothetical protein
VRRIKLAFPGGLAYEAKARTLVRASFRLPTFDYLSGRYSSS